MGYAEDRAEAEKAEREAFIKLVKKILRWAIIVIGVLFILVIANCSWETVQSGHVKVGKVFGKVRVAELTEGFHLVNPIMTFTDFDGREKTLKITAEVPSRDQMTTNFDLSIQYRLNKDMASKVLSETGKLQTVVDVHLTPRIRSLIREQGKGVAKAEDFFKDEIQRKLQTNLLSALQETMSSKGLIISAVLIRDVNLPKFIIDAIQRKKEREQDAEKEVAELKRFTTEQEKKTAEARADFDAAKIDAKTRMVAADAKAYENKKLERSITDKLIRLRRIEKWDGVLPTVTGGNTPFISLKR